MQFKHATLDVDGPVAILRLDHQDVMNAVSMDMLGGLAEALDAIKDQKSELRCVVLTGVGRAFCTGANLQGRNNQKPGKSNAGASLEIGFHPFLRRLRNLHCPLVTAVNGPAAGAGMSFALMGDMILCARSAYFLQAFRRIGLVPDCGSTWGDCTTFIIAASPTSAPMKTKIKNVVSRGFIPESRATSASEPTA